MTGTLAQTIQGEAGSNPANQFAVASTIYNRMQAGSFPGGTNPVAIVNAPQQFVGFAATPNASAQQFADAIQNGTLSNFGSTGNAVNFQSGQTAASNGFTQGGANIGGNFFSDRFGSPTSNFQAPQYGGSGALAQGPADTSTGSTVSSDPLGSSVTMNPSGASSSTSTGTGSTPAQGAPIQTALQPEEVSQIGSWITNIENSVGGAFSGAVKSAETAVATYFAGIQNWLVRALLIVAGIVLVAIALIKLMSPDESIARSLARLAPAME